jgi:hypothetical protein
LLLNAAFGVARRKWIKIGDAYGIDSDGLAGGAKGSRDEG